MMARAPEHAEERRGGGGNEGERKGEGGLAKPLSPLYNRATVNKVRSWLCHDIHIIACIAKPCAANGTTPQATRHRRGSGLLINAVLEASLRRRDGRSNHCSLSVDTVEEQKTRRAMMRGTRRKRCTQE